jgi:hypothetical protein
VVKADGGSWAVFCRLPDRTGPRVTLPWNVDGDALRPTLSATPAGAALGWHQVVGGEFVAIATARWR